SGDMAWATFDQNYPSVVSDVPHVTGVSHEARVFEKHDGKWLIAFWGVMHGSVGRYDSPILHVTEEGKVTWQSPRAVAALEADDDLTIRNWHIRFRDAKANQKLQAALRWAAARDKSLLPERGALPVPIEAGEGLPTKVYWIFAEGGLIILSPHKPGRNEDRLGSRAD